MARQGKRLAEDSLVEDCLIEDSSVEGTSELAGSSLAESSLVDDGDVVDDREVGDRDIVRKLLVGEARAWASVSSELRKRLIAFRLPLDVDREELVCDTVASLWKSLPKLRDGRRLLVFATTIARRLAVRRIAEQRRWLPLAEESRSAVSQTAKCDCALRNAEAEELLQALLGLLSAADRALFRSLYVNGESHAEIAAAMGISRQALRKQKCLLHRKLRSVAQRHQMLGAGLKLGFTLTRQRPAPAGRRANLCLRDQSLSGPQAD